LLRRWFLRGGGGGGGGRLLRRGSYRNGVETVVRKDPSGIAGDRLDSAFAALCDDRDSLRQPPTPAPKHQGPLTFPQRVIAMHWVNWSVRLLGGSRKKLGVARSVTWRHSGQRGT
jgi:hypothetical protein